MSGGEWKNKLYFGDNLEVLKEHISDESIDLIYLDPPFNSKADYNLLYRESSGSHSEAQIAAFEDTWQWGRESNTAFEAVLARADRVADVMAAFKAFLGSSNMMAYLAMMAVRMVELHRVLKGTGSLYLHCDSSANHYLKILLDAIFGHECFRNDIRWKRQPVRGGKSVSRQWARTSDSLLFYTKSLDSVWNRQYRPYSDEFVKAKFRPNSQGRLFRDCDLGNYSETSIARFEREGRIYVTSTGKRRLIRFLDEEKGEALGDFWLDPAAVNSRAHERVGFPTQKPEALLERIILASSRPGDIILDPFCGCGTAIVAAERLNRKWVGIDITYLAMEVVLNRLKRLSPTPMAPYEVNGLPKDLASAQALSERDKFLFQTWALGKIGAKRNRKGSDRGIDGWLAFKDSRTNTVHRAVVSVKGGKNVGVAAIRDLRGVIDRDKSPLGVLITLYPPTSPMVTEALEGGPSRLSTQVRRIQILTAEDLLQNKKPQLP